MEIKSFFIFCFFAMVANLYGQTIKTPNYIPEGWRIPTSNDIKKGSEWQSFKEDSNSIPIYVKGDFNGDGKEDYAWLLIKSDNSTWGLFAFLKNQGKGFTKYLIGHQGRPSYNQKPQDIQNLYSENISDCQILKTGKGEKLCLFDKNSKITKRVTTRYDVIIFGVLNAGQPSFFYYDAVIKKFISYWSCDNDGD